MIRKLFLFFVILFLGEYGYSQEFDFSQKSKPLVQCDSLIFDLVSITNTSLLSAMDTSLLELEVKNRFTYLYLEVRPDSSIVFSKTHIEQFVYSSKNNKVAILNGRVILVRDDENYISNIIPFTNLSILNPKELTGIIFNHYPFKVFVISSNGNVVERQQW